MRCTFYSTVAFAALLAQQINAVLLVEREPIEAYKPKILAQLSKEAIESDDMFEELLV